MDHVPETGARQSQTGAGPSPPVLDYGMGRAAPRVRPPRPPILRVAVAGLLLFPLVVAAAYPLARLLPWGWEAGAFVEVPTRHPGRYGSTASFHIQTHGTGRGNAIRLDGGYIVYGGMEKPGSLDFDLRAMTYRLGLYGYEHLGTRPLTRDSVLDYISRAGFAPDSVEGGAVADAILAELRKLRDGQLPPDVSGQPYAGQVPCVRSVMTGESFINLGGFGHLLWLPWYTPWCLPAWLGAWWLASLPFVRRYRRKLAEFEAAAGAVSR
jgi:hypothetical protein